MLNDTKGQRVYLARGSTDLRKSIDGLTVIVKECFELDPFSPCLFVFCNRKRDKLKIMQWEHNGFWLHYRRLEKGTFHWSYSDRRFYYAMGYGATGGGDITGDSGFDKQISGGSQDLHDLWLNSPSSYPVKMTVNNGQTVTANGVTYKGYIWVKNCGTYVLYKYTPWTIDKNYLPNTITGGNYLFITKFNQYVFFKLELIIKYTRMIPCVLELLL